MHQLWPWILLGLLGAYHGLNPAMGWLFAVALGMQEGDRKAVVRALPAIAIGHEASILVIAVLVLGLGLITDPSALHLGAGVALIAFGLFRFIKPRAHFRWVMRGNVGRRELAGWSFRAWARVTDLADAPRLELLAGRLPRTVVAVGTLDSLLPESRALADACARAGVECHLVELDGAEHGFVGTDRADEALAAFHELTTDGRRHTGR